MSIMDRLNLLIRSNLNDTLGKSSGASADKALAEVGKSLREARRHRATLRRDEKKLVAQIREERDKTNQWEERAMLALRNDDEELAREALVVKNQSMRRVEGLRDELDDLRSQIEDIERALEALEHKLEGTKSRLKARSSGRSKSSTRRRSREEAWEEKFERRRGGRSQGSSSRRPEPADPDVSDAFDTTRQSREFNRMASKIDGMEAEVEAMRELSDLDGDRDRRDLEDRFQSLEGRRRSSRSESSSRDQRRPRPSEDDDDLADLKKKFE